MKLVASLLALMAAALPHCGKETPGNTAATDTAHPDDTVDSPVTDTGPLGVDELQYGDLVISEVHPSGCLGGGNVVELWIEIHNLLDRAIELQGLTIVTAGAVTIDEPLSLPAQGYLTVARGNAHSIAHGFEPDYLVSNLNLGCAIRIILLADETLLDMVDFEETEAYCCCEGRSVSLSPDALDADANDDDDSWCHAEQLLGEVDGCSLYGTPGAANEVCTNGFTDLDGDGHDHDGWGGTDCDDQDASVHPDALESCDDALDNDCDGATDCEDEDCQGVPPCEQCDNDLDDDGDGLVDCEDDDCAEDEQCVEQDCGDGLDDDGDGLMDCEDGDCAEDEQCVELNCDDGLDSDDDGLVDCEDDDCWGPACHVGVRVQPGTATLEQTWSRRRGLYDASIGVDEYLYRLRTSAVATGLAGNIQVLPSWAHAWSTTTARSTCTFVVDEIRFERSLIRTNSATFHNASVQRQGVSLEPGCRVTTSWVLPERLVIHNSAAYRSWWCGMGYYSGTWYRLSLLDSSVSWSTVGGDAAVDPFWHSWKSGWRHYAMGGSPRYLTGSAH